MLNKVTFNSPTLTGIHQVAVDPVAVGVRVVIRVVDGPIFEVVVGAVSLHALEPAVIQHTGQGERRYSEVVHVGMEVQVLETNGHRWKSERVVLADLYARDHTVVGVLDDVPEDEQGTASEDDAHRGQE